MDGIGDVYNYIRQDGDWKTVEAHMLTLSSEPNIDLAAGITVQAHNVYQMPEFYDYWKASPINLAFITANILQTPNYLNPAVWHSKYKTAIIRKLRQAEARHPEMDRFATYMEHNTDDNYAQYMRMRKYTRDIEKRYKPNTSLSDMVNDYLSIELESMDSMFKQQNNFL